jgi:hypothetical protein
MYNIFYRSVALFFILCAQSAAIAQLSNTNDSIKFQYKFINTEKNKLEGDTASLSLFFDKLMQL